MHPPGGGGSETRFSDSGLGFNFWDCFEPMDAFWEGLETSRNRKENEHLERYWRVRFLGYGSVIEDWCCFPLSSCLGIRFHARVALASSRILPFSNLLPDEQVDKIGCNK